MKTSSLFACIVLAIATLLAPSASAQTTVRWSSTGGSGVDMGYGGGKAWAVGGDGGVYRFDVPPGAWTRIQGLNNGARIDVDHMGMAWVVTRDNKLFAWNGSGWSQSQGDFRDVGVSPARDVRWAVGGGTDGRGNFNIYRWDGARWAEMPGMAARIDVDQLGTPWVVNAQNAIYYWVEGTRAWNQVSGGATDIGAGADGSIWIVGTDGTLWAGGVQGWVSAETKLSQVTADEYGNPWGVGPNGQLVRGDRTDKRIASRGMNRALDTVPGSRGTTVLRFISPSMGTRWVFPPDGSIRLARGGQCLHLGPPSDTGTSFTVGLAKCDGSAAAVGWSYRAADGTIRKASHPQGCLMSGETDGSSGFGDPCPLEGSAPARRVVFDLR